MDGPPSQTSSRSMRRQPSGMHRLQRLAHAPSRQPLREEDVEELGLGGHPRRQRGTEREPRTERLRLAAPASPLIGGRQGDRHERQPARADGRLPRRGGLALREGRRIDTAREDEPPALDRFRQHASPRGSTPRVPAARSTAPWEARTGHPRLVVCRTMDEPARPDPRTPARARPRIRRRHAPGDARRARPRRPRRPPAPAVTLPAVPFAVRPSDGGPPRFAPLSPRVAVLLVGGHRRRPAPVDGPRQRSARSSSGSCSSTCSTSPCAGSSGAASAGRSRSSLVYVVAIVGDRRVPRAHADAAHQRDLPVHRGLPEAGRPAQRAHSRTSPTTTRTSRSRRASGTGSTASSRASRTASRAPASISRSCCRS